MVFISVSFLFQAELRIFDGDTLSRNIEAPAIVFFFLVKELNSWNRVPFFPDAVLPANELTYIHTSDPAV